MTALLGLLVLLAGIAHAEEPANDAPTEDDPLSPYRAPFDVLVDRAIGTTSRPVAFDWRRTDLHIAATGSFLSELNNFNSVRGGLLARVPGRQTIVEIGASWASVSDTPSSRTLALTPYRQPGRPDRLDLDLAVGWPLAEGVVTAAPRFVPPAQLVLQVYAGLRYVVYPTGWGGMRPGQVAGAILSPRLTEIELENLEDARLDAMKIDTGRYGLLVGIGNDLYIEQGVFLSPRVMVAVPLLAPATGTELLVWTDVTLAIGVAF